MTEYWVSQGNHWCEYCKCWMNNNPKTIAIHTQGPKHKQNVEERMRTIRRNAEREKREEDLAKRTMASIEAAARRAYEKDLQEGRPEDMLGPQLPGDGNMGPGYPLHQSVKTMHSVRDSGGSHLAAVGTPSEAASSAHWVWDSVSGYWYDDGSKFFYDSVSGMYCNPSTGAWQEQAPPPPKKRAPPPPPPKRQASDSASQMSAVPGLENVPQSMRAAGARAAGEACSVCGGSTAGCPACSGTSTAVGMNEPKTVTDTVEKAAPKPKPRSAFDLGYGTLHPKFLQAAKKKENTSAFKRARSPPREISEKEKEELARREAARARVAGRTNSQFGLK